MKSRRRLAVFLAALVLPALALTAYWPGLHGSFLFDDFGDLPALGLHGPIDRWSAFWRYVTSGSADPTGRPLTLLTFLLDSRNWPASPLPFKRTNLILHLLNGGFLLLLLRQLGRLSFSGASIWRIDLAAGLGSGIWMLHPLLVSTTLYVIQREAMLSATFTLLGLLAWLRGRVAILHGRRIRGMLWMATGLGGCTVLGVLSKANGVLLPALALVLEYALLRAIGQTDQPAGDEWRWYRRLMLPMAWLPTSLIAAYLLREGWKGLQHGAVGLRPWTIGQRLLTEPRVLMKYVDLLWLPRPFTPGLFNDQINASASLWVPATTLPALLAVLALIIGAWLLRRHWPAVCAATLFYFVGQSLESSTISLELYFEHRNYLPAMIMFWPLALWLCGVPHSEKLSAYACAPVRDKLGPRRVITDHSLGRSGSSWFVGSSVRIGIATLILLGLALMTHARAELWGNTHDQALLWASLNPDSPRAQTYAAQQEMADGHFKQAQRRLAAALDQHPDQVQLAFNLLDAQCQQGGIDVAALDDTHTALRITRDPGSLLVNWFGAKINALKLQPCRGLTRQVLAGLLDIALSNPNLTSMAGRRQDIFYLQGLLILNAGDGTHALIYFNRALDQQVRPSAALEQAATLGAAGFPQLGLNHLAHFDAEQENQELATWGMPRIHAWVIRRQGYWDQERVRLKRQLALDANARNTNTVGSSATQGPVR